MMIVLLYFGDVRYEAGVVEYIYGYKITTIEFRAQLNLYFLYNKTYVLFYCFMM